MRTTPALDLQAPVGTYKVDAYVNLMFPNAVADDLSMTNQDPLAPIVALMRREVNRAAKIAITRHHQEQIELRKAREKAKRLLDMLERFEREAAELFLSDDDAVNAADIAEGFASDASVSVARPLVQIIEDINSLASSSAELRRIGIAAPPPSRSDPLARWFIDAMASAYAWPGGEQPPATRAGPFVDLLAAAWTDLGFPLPKKAGDEGLREWLGTKVERRRQRYRI